MKRVIFLVDMNAFFISCEMTRYPELVGVPAAVAGDPKKRTGIILAANYEARKFGVKTAMTLHEALKCCPHMKLVHPDHKFYSQKSNEVFEILSDYTPVLEKNSIDEAWLDMTGCEGLFGKPLQSAERIMNHLKKEVGLPCSIGISENKFLSKMAAEMKKPLGITELWVKDIETKLWPLPVREIYGIGKQTAVKLNNMGIETIGDLIKLDQSFIIKHFGKLGLEIYQKAKGVDFEPVKPISETNMKSIGKSITLAQDISEIDIAKHVLKKLAEEVGMTARKYDKKGSTIQITIKYSNFETITRQITVSPTNLTKQIASYGIRLLEKNWGSKLPIRLLGISLSGFAEDEKLEQISLFDLCKEKKLLKKEEKLEKTIDSIRNKYGNSKISRAIFIKDK
ncbi:DNA polymerase IV [Serpentinicella alkaliphila]|uniref:DNA polymerase IV n=1 Tax=Serpentinicella alkaliphila TaxID=1734049 RepID=A0A4R2TLU1_9FIRM|nr:DNA polymerase IV [Serpentinicella alkaliphila]QUH24521.1 DNA polymerase IV [Serpentinicella alkaliphila]TCQ04608.1 DNA polymerase-4 [Serpentinicella alkaliphila]